MVQLSIHLGGKNMAVRKTYVKFYYPGTIVDESTIAEVKSRGVSELQIPDGAFGFQFFDLLISEDKGVEMVSDRLDVSKMHYYGGRIMTVEEVIAEMPEKRILIANMRANGFKVIHCPTGNFKPFFEEDIYIQAS